MCEVELCKLEHVKPHLKNVDLVLTLSCCKKMYMFGVCAF